MSNNVVDTNQPTNNVVDTNQPTNNVVDTNQTTINVVDTNQPTNALFEDKQTPTQPSMFHNLHILPHSKILSRITDDSRIVNGKKASRKVTQLCNLRDLHMSILLCFAV
jgi:hypothetical protein